MHYLQVTFGDDSPRQFPGAGEPLAAECVSVDGSTATTGDAGEFCLASDLRTLTADTANFAAANDLFVAGLHYLQVTFRDGSPLAKSGHSPGAGAKCGSVGGSTAATGNTRGFCLVSDRNTSKTGFANFAVANDSPVATLQFVRVPFRDRDSPDGSRLIPSADPPMGVVISDPDRLPIHRLSPPALAGIADHPQRYFPSSERGSGIVMHLSPPGRRHPSPAFWLSHPGFTCNGLPATIFGNNNDNTIFGTQGNDVIHGRGGNDVIHGLQGNDVICGGAGNDQLFGNRGRDQLFGEAGNDTLKGGIGNDRLFGQEGNDAIRGQKGNDDNCNGGIGADTARSCERLRKVP
jgi:RTX calcium-binding nonapeptide repeat (4 copies)